MDINRRTALQGIGSLVALPPRFSIAQAEDLADAHLKLADFARRVAKREDQTINLLVPDGCQPNLRPVIETFKALTKINVELTVAPVDDINTELLLRDFSNNSDTDLALVASFGMSDLVQANTLQTVDALEKRYPIARSVRKLSLYQHADGLNGRTYGPQFDGDLYLMFYNQAILENPAFAAAFKQETGEAFGIAKSWQHLDQMMQFVQDQDEQLSGGVLFRTPGYINWEFWVRLHARGLLPFDNDMRPTVTSRIGIEVIDDLVEATRSQHPGVKSMGLVENWEAFTSGKAFCHIGWGGSQKYFRTHSDNLQGGVVVSQLPGISGGIQAVPLFNWGWNFAIPRASAQVELAFLFAAFAVTPHISAKAVSAADGFIDPFQAEHYRTPSIIETYGQEFLTVHETGMRTAIPDFYVRGHREYMEALSSALLLADRGQISAVDASDNISKRWEEITDRLGRSAQIAQWRSLKRLYPREIIEAING
ncbi:MAG: ABC transporter substrate-binding protein [Woeseiaceae bacterium]